MRTSSVSQGNGSGMAAYERPSSAKMTSFREALPCKIGVILRATATAAQLHTIASNPLSGR